MRFFHLSTTKYEDEIPPTLGSSRHGAEDPRAVGKAAVWLSNVPMIRSDRPQYQYEVDLDPNDPDLFEDTPFKEGTAEMNRVFGGTSTIGWYFYFGKVPITGVRSWDEAVQKYV